MSDDFTLPGLIAEMERKGVARTLEELQARMESAQRFMRLLRADAVKNRRAQFRVIEGGRQ